ncbi:MAG: DUF4388 domain-containing protein [Deltaproteobacteria bacterium]|nr:DUF4388 domain-containing protein [Deltaproteobacteria bacterium]
MELRGNLKDFGLADIIQLVGFGRKSGALRVDCEAGGAALFFEDGNVVHAEYPGAEGTAAVFTLFRVPAGEFQFQSDSTAPRHTIAMDPTNLVMEAARLLDESRRDGDGNGGGWDGGGAELGDDWLGTPEPIRDPAEIKKQIRDLLQKRFGRGAKRLLQAVDQCGDSDEDLLGLAERVEKYVHVFLDNSASRSVGEAIRAMVTGSAS